MGSVHETVKTVNNSVRTLLMTVLMGVAGVLGYQGYEIYNEPQSKLKEKEEQLIALKDNYEESRQELATSKKEISALNDELTEKSQEIFALNEDIAEKAAHIDRLDTSLRLLKVERRLAQLRVLGQSTDPDAGTTTTKVSFVETDPEGNPIGKPQQFDIVGDMVYIDYLVAKFDDNYIEQADLERGTAICLFQRIFGENQEPKDGFELDRVGTRPTAYARGGAISEFEQAIWDDFWTIANNPDAAQEIGIRAAHGNAASIRVKPGKTYQLELRATGEFSLRPAEVTSDAG